MKWWKTKARFTASTWIVVPRKSCDHKAGLTRKLKSGTDPNYWTPSCSFHKRLFAAGICLNKRVNFIQLLFCFDHGSVWYFALQANLNKAVEQILNAAVNVALWKYADLHFQQQHMEAEAARKMGEDVKTQIKPPKPIVKQIRWCLSSAQFIYRWHCEGVILTVWNML